MKKFLFSFLFILFAGFCFAQELEQTETADQDEQKPLAAFASYQGEPKQVSFAKPFDLTVNLQKPAKLEAEKESDFEIININEQDPSNIILTVVPFNLGISTFTATLIDEQGQAFSLPALPLEIKKVKTKYDGQNLLDIRGPYKPSNLLFNIVLFLLILVLIIYFIIWYQKRKARAFALKINNPYLDETKTPEEVALSQIDKLLLQDLWASGQYKLFYIYLTDILRDYLTARFGFEAHKFTTKDLLRYIKTRQDFKQDLRNPLEIFLRSSDFVKFAKAIPTLQQRERNLSDLRTVIKENALPAADKAETENKQKGEQK